MSNYTWNITGIDISGVPGPAAEIGNPPVTCSGPPNRFSSHYNSIQGFLDMIEGHFTASWTEKQKVRLFVSLLEGEAKSWAIHELKVQEKYDTALVFWPTYAILRKDFIRLYEVYSMIDEKNRDYLSDYDDYAHRNDDFKIRDQSSNRCFTRDSVYSFQDKRVCDSDCGYCGKCSNNSNSDY